MDDMRHGLATLLLALTTVTAPSAFAADGTIEAIRSRGELLCGTSQGVPGFSFQDDKGVWKGFDTDICHALSAVVLGDPEKVRYVSLSSQNRLTALQSSEVDVLPRTTTWTLGRDAGQGLSFTAVNYYDGQGFMVRKSLGVKALADLNGATVCVSQGTTSELNLADYFRAKGLQYSLVTFGTPADAQAAYEGGRCDAYTTDVSSLAAVKLKFPHPDDFVILPDMISEEPLGPWVRQADDRWFKLVRWTIFALVQAENLGITQSNVEAMRKSDNPQVRRLLGVDGSLGQSLGVTDDWVVRIVKAVGNYGESFDRNLGDGSRLKLPRGQNRLWTQGGLQFSPPFH
jgi:general L-amino acid transport system substrate-binding protein